jgi:glycosyltransferase involved in cell wall biosynthesis
MPSVVFLPGQPGGTAEYRCHTPGRALERLGWDVAFQEHIDLTTDGRVRDDPDVVVVSRAMGEYLPDAFRRIRRHGRTLTVYDIDDWFAGVPAYNPASRLDPAVMHATMAEADLITCSTPELAEGYAHLGPTVVLPNYLDPDIWTGNQKYRTPRAAVHVGWMGAFHWRSGDLDLLRPWLPRWLDENPGVRFVAAGCPELLDHLGIDGLTTPKYWGNPTSGVNANLYPYEFLPAMLAHIDVGLVPLLPSRFNNAKSWCKGMEYNAMGIPSVASPSREYRRFVEPGGNGVLVRKNEWPRAIERVMDDLDGYRARSARMAERYFIDHHAHRWADAYASCRQMAHAR